MQLSSKSKMTLEYKSHIFNETLDADASVENFLSLSFGERVAASGNFLNHCLTIWRKR
jgi:hypothetical protein